MNEHEKALHIGEIILHFNSGGTVTYKDGEREQVLTLKDNYIIQQDLIAEHPHRYSIFKEPECLWVNLYQAKDGPYPYEVCRHNTEDSAMASASEDAVVVAHKIEIPNQKEAK